MGSFVQIAIVILGVLFLIGWVVVILDMIKTWKDNTMAYNITLILILVFIFIFAMMSFEFAFFIL